MNETIITEPNQKWVLFTYHEAGFVFYPTFVKEDGLWYFWMKMKTDQHVAAKWRFHAKAENEENDLSVEFTGHVQPIDLGLGEILESGQYMVFTKQNVMKLKMTSSEEKIKDGFTDHIVISFKLFKK